MFLADQGAEVIKIEPLGGDITRRSRQSISASGEFSALFVSTNRGKRSLALDLKRPEAAKIMRKLISSSDVLVQNFRPGTMERLGFGEPAMRELNPRVVYVSISGVGESGPYAKKRVYDPIIQGLSGFADLQAEPKTRRPQMIRTIVADKTTVLSLLSASLRVRFQGKRSVAGIVHRLDCWYNMVNATFGHYEAAAPLACPEKSGQDRPVNDSVVPSSYHSAGSPGGHPGRFHPDAKPRDAIPRLAPGAGLIVSLFLSVGLWGTVWLAVSALAAMWPW
jgi:crotonobetainyl-CoA:carnitine CoA-transferase CaiB-like acyl-CoA transferase